MSEKVGKCQYEGCNREPLPDSKDQYCICHEKRNEKDIEAFNKEIEKIMEKKEAKEYNFKGFYFPKKFNFEVIYRYLDDRTFEKNVTFRRAIFKGEADFSEAEFRDTVDFDYAKFENETVFSGTKFHKTAFFIGTKFIGSVLFYGTMRRDQEFFGDPHHQKHTVILPLPFEASFEGHAIFKDTWFGSEAIFCKVLFKGETSFSVSTFRCGVDFSRAKFQDEVNFAGTKFRKVAKFDETEFYGLSNFSYFTDHEYELHATKFKEASFYKATFEKRADFENCEIEEKIIFSWANFYDELLLTNVKGNPIFDFRNTRFSDTTRIDRGTKLDKALFNLDSVERVDFPGAEFPEKIYEQQLLEKKELNDEEKKYCPKNWEEVSSIYRKLKQAHQKYGDYAKAGEFYYREMECKKFMLRKKRISLNYIKSFGYFFLKYSCGYGEKPLIVLRNWLILIFGFAIAYFFSKSISFSGTSMLEDIFQSIYFSIITFTTLGYGDMQPISNWGRGFVMTEAILGAIFIALFIFVFGRKMMR